MGGRLRGAYLVPVVLPLRIRDDSLVDVDVGPGAEATLAAAHVLGSERELQEDDSPIVRSSFINNMRSILPCSMAFAKTVTVII